jgi:hypothetical protein
LTGAQSVSDWQAMAREGTAGRYVWLWLFGLALGWFEAAVVIDLRELYYPRGFHFPILVIWDRMAFVEVAREAASMLILIAGGRLAGVSFLERFGAFMFLFGLWDLVYYACLKLVLGWPESLATWDLLFLLPGPWAGPIWAPCVVSLALVTAGSYLFWTAERWRVVGAFDWAVEVTAGTLVMASFVLAGRVVPEGRSPESFPSWLFWAGLFLGVAGLLRVERRRLV